QLEGLRQEVMQHQPELLLGGAHGYFGDDVEPLAIQPLRTAELIPLDRVSVHQNVLQRDIRVCELTRIWSPWTATHPDANHSGRLWLGRLDRGHLECGRLRRALPEGCAGGRNDQPGTQNRCSHGKSPSSRIPPGGRRSAATAPHARNDGLARQTLGQNRRGCLTVFGERFPWGKPWGRQPVSDKL